MCCVLWFVFCDGSGSRSVDNMHLLTGQITAILPVSFEFWLHLGFPSILSSTTLSHTQELSSSRMWHLGALRRWQQLAHRVSVPRKHGLMPVWEAVQVTSEVTREMNSCFCGKQPALQPVEWSQGPGQRPRGCRSPRLCPSWHRALNWVCGPAALWLLLFSL